ncbi:MAG: hypothetical protein JST32_17130 [Bacteroidetes bacterium]|nr:hypothetical protein [Bacteroidota bacterium]
MHLIHSAMQQNDLQPAENPSELQLRYRAYLDACKKHERYIREIQKHLPGWLPKFR